MTRFQWGLALALVATVAAAWMAPPADSSDELGVVVRPTSVAQGLAQDRPQGGGEGFSRTDGARSERSPPAQVLVIRSRSAEDDASLAGLFSAPEWRAAKEVVPSPAQNQSGAVTAPPAPTAPELPFTLMGQLKDGAGVVYFLRNGEQSFVVKPGDTLLDTYRFEAVEGGKLLLRYLPLNQVQTIDLGSSS